MSEAPAAADTGGRGRHRHPRAASRATPVIITGGALLALPWQLLSPLGTLTLRPAPSLPSDVPNVAADGWFTLLNAGYGLVCGLVFLVALVRVPKEAPLVRLWVQWFAAGLIAGVATLAVGYLLELVARLVAGSPAGEQGSAPAMAWELASLVPLVAWPALFSLTTAIGATVSSMFSNR